MIPVPSHHSPLLCSLVWDAQDAMVALYCCWYWKHRCLSLFNLVFRRNRINQENQHDSLTLLLCVCLTVPQIILHHCDKLRLINTTHQSLMDPIYWRRVSVNVHYGTLRWKSYLQFVEKIFMTTSFSINNFLFSESWLFLVLFKL